MIYIFLLQNNNIIKSANFKETKKRYLKIHYGYNLIIMVPSSRQHLQNQLKIFHYLCSEKY